MNAKKIKTCVICEEQFEARDCRQKACRGACSFERARRYSVERWRNKRKPPLINRNCLICGQPLYVRDLRQKAHPGACSKKYNRQRASENAKRKRGTPIVNKKNCIVCGKSFIANYSLRLTCGDECKRIRKNRHQAERLQALPKLKLILAERQRQRRQTIDGKRMMHIQNVKAYQKKCKDPEFKERNREKGLKYFRMKRLSSNTLKLANELQQLKKHLTNK